MNRSVLWSRIGVGAAVAVVMAAGSSSAVAQEDDGLALKMAEASKPGRFFMRAGAIYVKVKTKSGDTYDVTGPLITLQDLEEGIYTEAAQDSYPDATGITPANRESFEDNMVSRLQNVTLGVGLLTEYMRENNITGIGTPAGVKGKAAGEMGTLGLSLGYYLDDENHWSIEAYVLAAPLKTSVTARGSSYREGDEGFYTRPIAIDKQEIISTKLLPPTVMFGRQWGEKTARFRPYTGLMATYAVFYDTKATNALNDYVGGSNPGDTTVSIKNAFGLGPVIGVQYKISENWHANLNIGHVKLKTQATLTTRNSNINSQSAVTKDLGSISDKMVAGENAFSLASCGFGTVFCRSANNAGGLVSLVTRAVLANKGQENFGTFVRKTDTTLTNTLFMLSVGRSF